MERVGVILSAGGSERWGGAPKALLPVGAETALGRIARLLEEAGVGRRRVVVGAGAEGIRRWIEGAGGLGLEIVEHPRWYEGRTSSVRAGLAELGDEEVVLWPVDVPMVAPGTLPRLLRAAERDALATWVLPVHAGRGGHPVLIKPPARRLIDELGPDEPLHHLLPRLGPQVLRVPTDDPGVAVNVNTPEEYWRARAAGLPREP
jgi:molybdenum cofactor cytidylyltransferase